MGMYTELVLSCRINNNPEIIAILKYMIGEEEAVPSLPDHELFKTTRWSAMLRCSSYYFVPDVVHHLKYDDIGEYWCFINRSDFKNYDGEVSKFIDWLTPYTENENMIGYSRYEEAREPTIYYGKES